MELSVESIDMSGGFKHNKAVTDAHPLGSLFHSFVYSTKAQQHLWGL